MAIAQPWQSRPRPRQAAGWWVWLRVWSVARQTGDSPHSHNTAGSEAHAAHETRQESKKASSSYSNTDAFEAFFTTYEHQVFGYLMRMTGDEQTAYDLSQETFLRAWQHFAKISGYDNPSAWLFRVATNLALSHLRRRASPVAIAKPLEDYDSPARSDPAIHIVESDLVAQTLLDLPPKPRAALVLREVYGLSNDEIARVLGMSRDAVKMALWRAREQFRIRYTQRGGRA